MRGELLLLNNEAIFGGGIAMDDSCLVSELKGNFTVFVILLVVLLCPNPYISGVCLSIHNMQPFFFFDLLASWQSV